MIHEWSWFYNLESLGILPRIDFWLYLETINIIQIERDYKKIFSSFFFNSPIMIFISKANSTYVKNKIHNLENPNFLQI